MLPDPRYSPFCWPFYYAWHTGVPNAPFFEAWPLRPIWAPGDPRLNTPLLGSGGRVIPKQSDWIHFCQSGSRLYGILADGSLWACGQGPLGDGTFDSQPVPVKISDGPWVSVATASNNTVAIDASGAMWTWGEGSSLLAAGEFWNPFTLNPRLMLSSGAARLEITTPQTAGIDPVSVTGSEYLEIIKSEEEDPGSGMDLRLDSYWSVSAVTVSSPSLWLSQDDPPLVISITSLDGEAAKPADCLPELEHRVVGLDFGSNPQVSPDAVALFPEVSHPQVTAQAVNNGDGTFSITNPGKYTSPPSVQFIGLSSTRPSVQLERRVVGVQVRSGGEYPSHRFVVSLAGSGTARVSDAKVVFRGCEVASPGSGYTSKESERLSAELVIPRASSPLRTRIGEIVLTPSAVSHVKEPLYEDLTSLYHIKPFEQFYTRADSINGGHNSVVPADSDPPTAELLFSDESTHPLDVERSQGSTFKVSLSQILFRPYDGLARIRVVFPEQERSVSLFLENGWGGSFSVYIQPLPRPEYTIPRSSPSPFSNSSWNFSPAGYMAIPGVQQEYATTGAWAKDIDFLPASVHVNLFGNSFSGYINSEVVKFVGPVEVSPSDSYFHARLLPVYGWASASTDGGSQFGGAGGGSQFGGSAGGGSTGGGGGSGSQTDYWPEFISPSRTNREQEILSSPLYLLGLEGGLCSDLPPVTALYKNHGGSGLSVSLAFGAASQEDGTIDGMVTIDQAGSGYTVEPEVTLTSIVLSPTRRGGSWDTIAITDRYGCATSGGSAYYWGPLRVDSRNTIPLYTTAGSTIPKLIASEPVPSSPSIFDISPFRSLIRWRTRIPTRMFATHALGADGIPGAGSSSDQGLLWPSQGMPIFPEIGSTTSTGGSQFGGSTGGGSTSSGGTFGYEPGFSTGANRRAAYFTPDGKVTPLGYADSFIFYPPSLPYFREIFPPFFPDAFHIHVLDAPAFENVSEVFSDAGTIFAKANGHLWRIDPPIDDTFSTDSEHVTSIEDMTRDVIPIYAPKATLDTTWNWKLEQKTTTVYVDGQQDTTQPDTPCHEVDLRTDLLVSDGYTDSSSSEWQEIIRIHPLDLRYWKVVITSGGSMYGPPSAFNEFIDAAKVRFTGGKIWTGHTTFTATPIEADLQTQPGVAEFLEGKHRSFIYPESDWERITSPRSHWSPSVPEEQVARVFHFSSTINPIGCEPGFSTPGWTDFRVRDGGAGGDEGQFALPECPTSLRISRSIEVVVHESHIQPLEIEVPLLGRSLSLGSLLGINIDVQFGNSPQNFGFLPGSDKMFVVEENGVLQLPTVEILSPEGGVGAQAIIVPRFSHPFRPVCLTQKHGKIVGKPVDEANSARFTSDGKLYSLPLLTVPLPERYQHGGIDSLVPGNAGITNDRRAVSFDYGPTPTKNAGNVECVVVNPGSRIRTLPRIVTSQPSSEIAVVDAAIDGRLVGIGVVNGGRGFVSPPAVDVDGSGSAEAVISGPLHRVVVDSPGSGYLIPPKVIFSGPGLPAIATCSLTPTGGVAFVNVQGGGKYREPPTVSFEADWLVNGIEITNGGEYEAPPTVIIAGGSGNGAAARCVINGQVTSVEVTGGGGGYTSSSPPQVVLMGGDPQVPATGFAVVGQDGSITSVIINNPGSFYQSAPAVLLTGGSGFGATARAQVKGPVASVEVTSGGAGYEIPPAVFFTGGRGFGASAVANVSQSGEGAAATAIINGSVIFCRITNPGGGYQFSPRVTALATPQNNFLISPESDPELISEVSPDLDARISGQVSSLSVTSPGSYYVDPARTSAVPVDWPQKSTLAWAGNVSRHGPWNGSGGERLWRFSANNSGQIQPSAVRAVGFPLLSVTEGSGTEFFQKPVVRFSDSVQADVESVRNARRTASSVRSPFVFVPGESGLRNFFNTRGVSFSGAKIKEISNFWSSRQFTTRSGKKFSLSQIAFASPPVFVIDDPLTGEYALTCNINSGGFISNIALPANPPAVFSADSRIRLKSATLRNDSAILGCTVDPQTGGVQSVNSSGGGLFLQPLAAAFGSGTGCLVTAVRQPGVSGSSPLLAVVVSQRGSGYQDSASVYVYEQTPDFMKTEHAVAVNKSLSEDGGLVKYEFLYPEYVKPSEDWGVATAGTSSSAAFVSLYDAARFSYPGPGGFQASLYEEQLLEKTFAMIDNYAECDLIETVSVRHSAEVMFHQYASAPTFLVEGVAETLPSFSAILAEWSELFGSGVAYSAGIGALGFHGYVAGIRDIEVSMPT